MSCSLQRKICKNLLSFHVPHHDLQRIQPECPFYHYYCKKKHKFNQVKTKDYKYTLMSSTFSTPFSFSKCVCCSFKRPTEDDCVDDSVETKLFVWDRMVALMSLSGKLSVHCSKFYATPLQRSKLIVRRPYVCAWGVRHSYVVRVRCKTKIHLTRRLFKSG